MNLETEAVISSIVTVAAWLVHKGHLDLAEEMRTQFMAEWGFDAKQWNDECDALIDYADRKGEGVDPAWSLRAVRIEMP